MTVLQDLLSQAKQSEQLRGSLKLNESLARYTTWRIGGKAECCYQPKDEADLQAVLQLLPENIAINWIGLGSNLLVRDGGVKGLIIVANGVLNKLLFDCEADHCLLSAQSGVTCAVFSRKAANNGLNGAEFLSGIPGTIGGALAMNAGAFGGETWRHVVTVKMINQDGEFINRSPEEFDIQYRSVKFKALNNKQEWFVSGTFCFSKDEQGLQQSKQEIKRLLTKRAETQPTKQANAGSVFKNPDNDYAARLIEECGLKGISINDAQISPKHANFIVNKGNAQAKDVEALIDKIKKSVFEQCRISLETEVKILGESVAFQDSQV